ncbi:MAG: tRNA pseudouridine(38-40) synthase TruA [Legionellales bacterium RIFCSPHIGHO2_12_FULL_35_11]|nr:MAG: tRNA pseudouridine(38-40) synthase TruA [Legionellales bacterium RIFCSPHIGHO2_12_FULL_35_11]
MRIVLVIEYDGSQYHGWQEQVGLKTLQSTLEKAISSVANHEVKVVCAGRTDTGVHASNQVIHFDSENHRSIRAWVYGVNSALPKDICVKWGKEISDEFHARFSAISRKYRYIIHNSAVRPALLRSNITWQYRQLDAHLMHEAAQCLRGEHDFTSYRSVECQAKTPMRNISEISVKRIDDLILIDIKANAFLHHMVRNIAGVLIAIGSGKKTVNWSNEVLLSKNRKLGAETAPPYGLYLMGVTYPKEFDIKESISKPLYID